MRPVLFYASLILLAPASMYIGAKYGSQYRLMFTQKVDKLISKTLKKYGIKETKIDLKNFPQTKKKTPTLHAQPPILFLHITNDSKWHPFRVCAVQSAAYHNPSRKVLLLSKYPMRKHKKWEAYPNIEIAKLDVAEVLKDTVLDVWYSKFSAMKKPPTAFNYDIADAVRYAYLFKYGGMYMDTDVITLRNLDNVVHNSIGMEDGNYVCNAVLNFDKDNPFLKEVILVNWCKLQAFPIRYSPRTWASGGPLLLTKLMKEYLGHVGIRAENVPDKQLNVAAQPYFYPFRVIQARMMFRTIDYEAATSMARNSFTVHLWKKALKTLWPKETIQNGSYIDHVFKKYCA